MPQPRNKSDLIIIGGGASGLAAACVAAARGRQVTVLEARDRPARKLLATGNGRCNLMTLAEPLYFGSPDFALSVLRACPREEVAAFFEGLGLTLYAEQSGLVYPATSQAASVAAVLTGALQQSGRCALLCGAQAVALRRGGRGFLVEDARGRAFTAPRVIAAAGGMAQPQLSGAEGIYGLLRGLGHRVTALRPALSALVTDPGAVGGLKGLRLPAVATLCADGRPLAQTQGEVLFAQDGVSGVCVMQLSRAAGDALAEGRRVRAWLDLRPMLGLTARRYERQAPQPPGQGEGQVLAWLEARARRLPDPLAGALPGLLAARMKGLGLREAARLLAAFPLDVRAVRGFDHAQVTAGGVDTAQVDPRSMESLVCPGLHITGETLDVDGDCGGHNLLFAWASGILAGRSA